MKTRIFQFLLVVFLFPVLAMANNDLRSQQIIELYAKLDGKKYETTTDKVQIHNLAKANYVKNAWNSDLALEVYNQLLNGTDYNDQTRLKTVLLFEMEKYDRANTNAPIYKMDKKEFNNVVTKIMLSIYPELDPANQSEADQRLATQGAVRNANTLTPSQMESRITEKLNTLKANGTNMSKYEAISIQ